jgi:hypothetical protein
MITPACLVAADLVSAENAARAPARSGPGGFKGTSQAWCNVNVHARFRDLTRSRRECSTPLESMRQRQAGGHRANGPAPDTGR